MTTTSPVDIVILNYNGWRDTIDCIESALRVESPRVRVTVCDNGSTDDSIARIEEWARGEQQYAPRSNGPLHPLICPAVRKPLDYAVYDRATAEKGGLSGDEDRRFVLLKTGVNLGFSGGNNVALRYILARHESAFVMLLNNDTIIAPTAVAQMLATLERDVTIGAVGATILDYQQTETVQEAAGGTVTPWHGMVRPSQRGARRGATVLPRRLDYVSGACLLTRVSCLRSIGLFDERFFMYGEDVDLSLRMRRAGFRLAYAQAAEIWHRGGGTAVPRSPFNDYHNVRSSLHFVAKHHPHLVPLAAAYSLYRCVLPKVFRREWSRLRATGRGYRDFIGDLARPSRDHAPYLTMPTR